MLTSFSASILNHIQPLCESLLILSDRDTLYCVLASVAMMGAVANGDCILGPQVPRNRSSGLRQLRY